MSDSNLNFQGLYEEHAKAIYRLSYRLLGNHEEARDLTHDAFLKLHRTLENGSRIDRPKSWIYKVATNLCLDQLRRKKIGREAIGEFASDRLESGGKDEGLQNDEIIVIRKSVAKLSERDRILVLLYQDDLTYAEMADATGIRKKSIGKILSRAIKKLATAINEGDSR
jgi:RNA polymerase sigma-70 factor (ECF subfamily)